MVSFFNVTFISIKKKHTEIFFFEIPFFSLSSLTNIKKLKKALYW